MNMIYNYFFSTHSFLECLAVIHPPKYYAFGIIAKLYLVSFFLHYRWNNAFKCHIDNFRMKAKDKRVMMLLYLSGGHY